MILSSKQIRNCGSTTRTPNISQPCCGMECVYSASKLVISPHIANVKLDSNEENEALSLIALEAITPRMRPVGLYYYLFVFWVNATAISFRTSDISILECTLQNSLFVVCSSFVNTKSDRLQWWPFHWADFHFQSYHTFRLSFSDPPSLLIDQMVAQTSRKSSSLSSHEFRN